MMKMEDILEEFRNFHVDEQLPSFIKIFLQELPTNVKFIYRCSDSQVSSPEDRHIKTCTNEDFEISNLDVTGSPLSFSTYSLRMDETVIKKCWSEKEEKYLPISLRNARIILGRYLTQVSSCNVPIWIMCDGLDTPNTLLLSAYKEGGWCSRSIVHYQGHLPLSEIKNLFDETTLTSNNVQVDCEFNLCEDSDINNTLLNSTQNEFVAQNCTYMSIKLQWLHPRFEVPQDGTSAVIAVNLNVGHKASAINVLWSQFKILVKYVENLNNIICSKQYAPVPSDYSNDKKSFQGISRKIISLINNIENTIKPIPFIQTKNMIKKKGNENIISILTKQIMCGTRNDFNITDKIWLLLNELTDVTSIAVCLNDVFSELGECKSKILPCIRNNDTLLAKMIAASSKGDRITEISIGKTAELMIQSGIEKLKHDYIYIFRELGVECSNYFKKSTLSIAKSLDIVNHNLNILAQMHVALDFICATQFYLNFDTPDCKIFSQSVFKESCRVISSLDVLLDNPHVHLEISVNFKSIVDSLPSNFSNLKLICSRDKEKRNYSELLVTSQSVFPPSLMQFDSENNSEEPETTLLKPQYHVYKLSSYCDRVE